MLKGEVICKNCTWSWNKAYKRWQNYFLPFFSSAILLFFFFNLTYWSNSFLFLYAPSFSHFCPCLKIPLFWVFVCMCANHEEGKKGEKREDFTAMNYYRWSSRILTLCFRNPFHSNPLHHMHKVIFRIFFPAPFFHPSLLLLFAGGCFWKRTSPFCRDS